MDSVCGSEFWNSSVTWNTEDPDFTPCFEKTVLVWVPCLFLWIFSPLEVYYLTRSHTRDIPWNWLNISKIVLQTLLVLQCIVELGYALHTYLSKGSVFTVDIYTPAIKGLSFAFCVFLTVYNRKRGLCTSGLIFLFYFLLAIGGVAQFRTEITRTMNEGVAEAFYFYSYVVYYPVVLLVLFLNFFADDKPKFSEYPPSENPCPETFSSFPSRLTFSWFSKLAWLGYRKPLETGDLWHINFEDSSSGVVPKFEKFWNKKYRKILLSTEVNDKVPTSKRSGSVDFAEINDGRRGSSKPSGTTKHQASILPVLCAAFGPKFLFGSVLKLGQDLLSFVSPQILELLIGFVEGSESVWRGYMYAGLLLLTAMLQTFLLSQYFNCMFLVGLRIRTALISAIYRKAMVMSNSARKESTVGEIVNLMSVDAQRFMDLLTYLNMIWSAPLQIFLALFFLWQTLGASVLAGLAVMIIMIPINSYIATRVKTLQMRQMKYKDERVKLMNEVLSGIKVLKLYAWEPSFEQQILRIRNKEVQVLKEAAYLNASTSFIWACAPFLVSLVTFAVYVLSDEANVLDSKKAFVSLSLFNILRFPLSMLPMLITNIVQAGVSIERINKFMNSEELDPNSVEHNESEDDPLIIENGSFSWGDRGSDGDDALILKNINVSIKAGSLVAVVGPVGSGKTSLVSAFLGEMDKVSGRVNTKGSIAYVPQQAWIQNATLQQNILFGQTLENSNYNRVIDNCALKQDFDMLPARDQTEIGEKGINLSGGQKQRVSLARAVYNNADIYLLDDPLSAVDSHVGKHIFEKVIGPKGMLKKKTRVLVTHGISFLPEVDFILVVNNGQVSEQGTYKELLAKKGAFADFIVNHLQDVDDPEEEEQLDELKQQLLGNKIDKIGNSKLGRQRSSESGSSTTSIQRRKSLENDRPPPNKNAIAIGEKLIETEKAETGSVKWHVYKHYIQSVGMILTVATFVINVIFQGFSIGSNLWLSKWSSDPILKGNGTNHTHQRNLYLGVYAGLGAGQAVTILWAAILVALGTLYAAETMHNLMLTQIFHKSLQFFDVTPIGRLLNRFSRDVDILDNTLPVIIRSCINCLFMVLATLVVISYTTPLFIFVILPVGIIYYFIQRFYVATSRQLKRLESVSRSPIYSHFGESVTGAQMIRAYGVQKRFIRESENKVDMNQVCYYPSLIANRWLAIRLETVGNLIIFFSALFAVIERNSMNSGLVGLSVSYALQITQTLNWLVRMTSDFETNIVAVERIKEYAETTQEAAWEITPCPVNEKWPEKGELDFNNFQLRYREGLDLVLKGITFHINSGEKIGIVGRTGAGKSSLTLALFRILESAGGCIYLDGVDISRLGLHTLRARLTIIPQDPVLFSGTLRMNLDPFARYTDQQVWQALEHAHLKTFVKGLTAGLQHQVTEGGENLSVGQRQLICLARALLRKTKVLVLDEATAAIDLETDELIQRTIRAEFRNCTVLTIAHRLNTIMDSDRVLVLDKGQIAEYSSPAELLKSKTSLFYSMVHDAGLV
ncbi:multidrug resistance-associated protein 1 isoform X2 [Nilaparvata lugens]|uniref:multidrug resistance-associated protein 1 isoform X2 n=1 Tax=Nilaparvata lugens TaxID=108931 RepID=UPI00193D54C7|nr:multidrug resistance-associated protein 1 isoform X2 [Nilaparvata lugens]